MSCLVKLFEPNSASPPVHVDLTAGSIEIVAVNQTTWPIAATWSQMRRLQAAPTMEPICSSKMISLFTRSLLPIDNNVWRDHNIEFIRYDRRRSRRGAPEGTANWNVSGAAGASNAAQVAVPC